MSPRKSPRIRKARLIVPAALGLAVAFAVSWRARANPPFNLGAFIQDIPPNPAYIKQSTTSTTAEFGISLAADGNTLVVGARYEDSSSTGINGSETVGASNYDAGAVYVFTRSGLYWKQQAYIKASNTATGDHFGASVAISGDTLAVGAPYEDSSSTTVNGNQTNDGTANSGAIYVFTRSGTTWSQQAYIKATNTGASDLCGSPLDLDGDTLAFSCTGEASSATGINGLESNDGMASAGAVFVFSRSGSTWSKQAYIKASNTDASDFFGFGLSLNGDTLVAGAYGEDSSSTGVNGAFQGNVTSPPASATNESGAAYVFTRSGSAWAQQAYIKASNTGKVDYFGYQVAIKGDTLAISAPLEDSSATGINGTESNDSSGQAGAAYIYTRSGTTWSKQAYIKPPYVQGGASPNMDFSSAVSLSTDGNLLAVGEYFEDSTSTGIGGTYTNTASADSGAVFMYTRSGSTWSYRSYVKPSNTGAADEFGFRRAVAIFGDSLAVGAHFEDSSGTGVNGNKNNEGSSNSGAVYVYRPLP